MFKPFSKLPIMVCRFVLMSSALVILLAFSGASQAHELRPAVADVTVTQTQIQVELQLTVETLLAGIDVTKVMDTDEAPQAETYDQLRGLTDVALAELVRAEWPLFASGLLIGGAGFPKLTGVNFSFDSI